MLIVSKSATSVLATGSCSLSLDLCHIALYAWGETTPYLKGLQTSSQNFTHFLGNPGNLEPYAFVDLHGVT